MTAKLKVIIYGIKVKLSRGEKLEEILESYTKLSDEEKEFIRNELEEAE
jgi:ribosomal protein S3